MNQFQLLRVIVVFWLTIGAGQQIGLAQNQTRGQKLAEFYQKFPQADTNRDQTVTMEEFRQFTTQRRQRREAAQAVQQRWRTENPPAKSDWHYGSHERQVLDFWPARGTGPHPLVIYIHGGGWVNGDKNKIAPGHVDQLRAAGVSVAAINYRYSTIAPYPTPLRDAGLAVQFLRHHASQLNLDPTRVACYGGSAGATSSLWLAYRDDMADPDAADPVLRQSTRLQAVGAMAAPTTLDKKTMDDWFGMQVVTHPAVFPLFDIEDESELYSEKIRQLAADGSPINLLTADDPPAYLEYGNRVAPLGPNHSAGEMIHHALFGKKLKEKAATLDVVVLLSTSEPENTPKMGLIEFLISQLKPE